MSKLEDARIAAGIPRNDPFNRKTLKEIRERRNREKARQRRGKKQHLAEPEDLKERAHFQLERAEEHISAGRATPEETDYLKKHL